VDRNFSVAVKLWIVFPRIFELGKSLFHYFHKEGRGGAIVYKKNCCILAAVSSLSN